MTPTRVYLFTSLKKRMSTVIPVGKKYRIFCKGASEIVLTLCNKIMSHDTCKILRLSDAERQNASECIDKMAREGLRTLCISYADLSSAPSTDENAEAPEKDLTLLAIVGIKGKYVVLITLDNRLSCRCPSAFEKIM